MKQNYSFYLNCPVRGQLKITGPFGAESSEEYRRIECVQFLIDKKYPKENIGFEKKIIKYGHSGRNSLRADLIVYNSATSNIEVTVEDIILVAEIKKIKR